MKEGFTLVEVVLAITLVALMATVGAYAFSPVLDTWLIGSSRGQAANSTSYALNRMMNEIAQLKDAQSVLTATANQFEFIDVDDNTIDYSLSGTNLMRNGNILARGVQALAFSYWDVNHQSLAGPAVSPSATDLWRVSIGLTSQAGEQEVQMETQVRPRNLPRP